MEYRIYICIDWTATREILSEERAIVAKTSCIALLTSVVPIAEQGRFLVTSASDDWFDQASKILATVEDANSKRLVKVPLRGVLVSTQSVRPGYSAVLHMLKAYSTTPTIAVLGREMSGTERLLAADIWCTILRSATIIWAVYWDKTDDTMHVASYDKLSTKLVSSLTAVAKQLCLCSGYGGVREDMLLSLHRFGLSTQRELIVTPDLAKHFSNRKLSNVVYEGQVFLCRSSPTMALPERLPIPEGQPAHSFLM